VLKLTCTKGQPTCSSAPRADSIAESLNVSLGSFLRRLRSEDTHFKDLLNDTRRDLATHYVKDSQRPLTEITFLLGFSDQSNFTRAFRRWHGVPPAKLREGANGASTRSNEANP